MENKILKTQNVEFGFWGTTSIHYDKEQTQKRWKDVFETLIELSGKPTTEIRDFLDSRFGRHLADHCYKEEDIKQVTRKCYFEWLEKFLFEDNGNKETDVCTLLYGTKVYNRIYDRVDILLYTYKNLYRVHEDYAMCIGIDGKRYRIGMDYIVPVEDMDDEELIKCGLK